MSGTGPAGHHAEARPLHLPAGSTGAGGELVRLAPEEAGWEYCGLRVLALRLGEERLLATGPDEAVLLPLAGSFEVEGTGFAFHLDGREDVFSGVSDFAYVPIGTDFRVTSRAGGRLAVATARAERHLKPAYGAATGVAVEIRGAGSSTRQVNNFFSPEAFEADKVMAVEVLTPAGNWSSYPPHKHDDERPGEAKLEEIYFFEFRCAAGAIERAGQRLDQDGDGFGLQHLYADDGLCLTAAVRSGDVVLVPRGYHGPSAAAPGYDMYYLNVLAGPSRTRSMAFCDDPAHSWVRASWNGETTDPRVPFFARVPDAPGSVAR